MSEETELPESSIEGLVKLLPHRFKYAREHFKFCRFLAFYAFVNELKNQITTVYSTHTPSYDSIGDFVTEMYDSFENIDTSRFSKEDRFTYNFAKKELIKLGKKIELFIAGKIYQGSYSSDDPRKMSVESHLSRVEKYCKEIGEDVPAEVETLRGFTKSRGLD